MSWLTPINPESLGRPHGYSNGILAPAGARLLLVAGQIGWDKRQSLVSSQMTPQFEQALVNVLEVVREAGGGPEHLARLTIYVTDRQAYLEQRRHIGEAYRNLMGKHYPAMALVEVKALLMPGALVEIEAMALLPG